MSADHLLEIAQRVAAQAAPGEQVEAFVERERETSVRVYEGEIEHLTSAQIEGVGVRVIKDGRVGFAYVGTLDDASLAEVLAEARDNVAFGTPDEWAGLAVPDGVAPAPVELWRDAMDGFPTEDKVALAKELERLTVGLDGRLRVEDANYADVLGESAVATSTGIAASGRATGCYVSVSTMADDGDETQTGFGFSVGREPGELDLTKAAGDGADRALRMLGATKPTSRKVTVVLDPFVTAQFLGVLSATLNGESVLKGRSLFAQRGRRAGGGVDRHARRRRHQPPGVHCHAARRRGPRHPAQHAHRRRRAARLRPVLLQRAPQRHRVDRQRDVAAASRARPAAAAWPCR